MIYLDIQSTASSPFPRAISNPPQLQPIEPISTIDCRAYCYNPPIPIPVVVVVVKMFLPCTYDPPCPQSLQNTFFCSHLSCTNLLHDFPRWVLDGWGLYEVTRNINVGRFIVGLIVGKSHRIFSFVSPSRHLVLFRVIIPRVPPRIIEIVSLRIFPRGFPRHFPARFV